MTLADAMLTARRAEASLNRALADYEASSNADTREFFLLKVQLLIFYYDVLTAMLSVARNNPKGFARAVALKPFANSLYEYERQINGTLVRRILLYASNQKKPMDTSVIRAANEKWRPHQTRIRGRRELRNIATGHYGKEWERQIELLKGISEKEVLSDAGACTEYTHFILDLLPHRKRGAA
jgi:hypothetical protein